MDWSCMQCLARSIIVDETLSRCKWCECVVGASGAPWHHTTIQQEKCGCKGKHPSASLTVKVLWRRMTWLLNSALPISDNETDRCMRSARCPLLLNGGYPMNSLPLNFQVLQSSSYISFLYEVREQDTHLLVCLFYQFTTNTLQICKAAEASSSVLSDMVCVKTYDWLSAWRY